MADGGHIEQENHCAKLEAFKMMSLTLHAPGSGRIYLANRGGCAIDAGDVVVTFRFG